MLAHTLLAQATTPRWRDEPVAVWHRALLLSRGAGGLIAILTRLPSGPLNLPQLGNLILDAPFARVQALFLAAQHPHLLLKLFPLALSHECCLGLSQPGRLAIKKLSLPRSAHRLGVVERQGEH